MSNVLLNLKLELLPLPFKPREQQFIATELTASINKQVTGAEQQSADRL